MVIYRRFITLVTAAKSIVAIELLISTNAPIEQTFRHSVTNLNFSSSVLAETTPKAKSKFRYVPPNRRPPKSTRITGSRGCNLPGSSQPVSLTLLVPTDHDGLTISGRPTFFWYASASVPMAFTLTQPGVVQPLFEQQIQPQEAGIVELKMPQNLPELVPGREYRWSVTLICNPDRPSANGFVQSWIKLVPTPPDLTGQIATATSERDRALIYAQAGLWYNALEAISTAHRTNPTDKSILDERLLLLEQAGQTEVATQERQRLARMSVQ
jgi:hypothetical protein